MKLSINPNAVGKDEKNITYGWQQADFTPLQLIQWLYFEAKAINPSLLDGSYRSADNVLGSELVVVDIDDLPPNTSIDTLLEDKYIARALCIIPSSGHSLADTPKYHIFYQLDSFITSTNVYKEVVKQVYSNISYTVDYALASVGQALFGTQYYKPTMTNHTKTLDDIWLNDNHKPLPTNDLIRRALENRKENTLEPVEDMGINKRSEKHYQQPQDVRTRITLEALDYVLRDIGTIPYHKDDSGKPSWLEIAISAYAGSNDFSVMEMLRTHEGIDGKENVRAKLPEWWDTFTLKKGYSVATLFKLAKDKGWLQHTSVEITDYTEFYAEEVADWLLSLNPLPKHLLVMSNTGTGKTLAAIELYKRDKPNKAVFFAPSIKLCYNLHATLQAHGIAAELYLDDTGMTRDGTELADAKVLVTTLQTFAVKVVQKGIDLKEYGLAVIDESDELISAFARAEAYNVGYASHVDRVQSEWGFYTLKRLFLDVKQVLMLDGTATQVSTRLGTVWGDLKVYKNKFKREKAPVKVVTSINDIRAIAFRGITSGKRVVVATAKRKDAEAFYEFINMKNLPIKSILITGDTSRDDSVNEFLKDVETGAKEYDLVVYNSAMGSGVSITETKPDVFVQIADYISPRKNLQILNRYRQQPQFTEDGNGVYVYMQSTENLYGETIDDKMWRINQTMVNEVQLSGISFEERSEIASIITDIAQIAVTDEYEQQRAYADFYIRLLKDDGRRVSYLENLDDTDDFKKDFSKVFELLKDRKEYVLEYWRNVEPISRDTPTDKKYTPTEYAQGLLHNRILKVVGDIDDTGLSDYELAKLVLDFGRYVWLVEKWLDIDNALSATLKELKDTKRALTTMKMYLSRIELINMVGLLFTDTDYLLYDDELENKASRFVHEITKMKAVYDTLVPYRYRYDVVMLKKDSSSDRAREFCKRILESIGLTIRRKTSPTRNADGDREQVSFIENVDNLLTLLKLRGNVITDKLTFSSERFYTLASAIQEAARRFEAMSKDEQANVNYNMTAMNLSFTESIEVEEQVF